MARVDFEGGTYVVPVSNEIVPGGSIPAPVYYAAAQPAPLIPSQPATIYGPQPTPQYLPYPDEQYTYSTYAPAAGNVSSAAGPQGGVVNYAVDADPNGYRWVDDGTPGGYWYRPSDGAVWRNTPLERAKQAAISAANAGGFTAIPQPITNAPVVRGIEPNQGWPVPGQPAPTASSVFTPTYGNTPENMGAFDLAYSNAAAYNQAIPTSPLYNDADMASLDLGFSNATSANDREQQRIIAGLNPDYSNVADIQAQLDAFQGFQIGEGAIPTPRYRAPVAPSAIALPEAGVIRPNYLPPAGPQGGYRVGDVINSGDDPMFPYPNWDHKLDNYGNWIPIGRPDDRSSVHPLLPSLWDVAPTQVRDRLPDWVDESAHFGLTGPGLALGMVLPVAGLGGTTGVGGLAARIGANAAQDLAFGAAAEGAQKAGVPTPYAQLIGLAAAVGSEAAFGKAVGKITANVAESGIREGTESLQKGVVHVWNNEVGGWTPKLVPTDVPPPAMVKGPATVVAPPKVGVPHVWDESQQAWVPKAGGPAASPFKVVDGPSVAPVSTSTQAAARVVPVNTENIVASAAKSPQVNAVNHAATTQMVNAMSPVAPHMEIAPIIQRELSIPTKTMNIVMGALGKGRRTEPVDAVARAIKEYRPRIQAVATIQAETLWKQTEEVFDFDSNHIIKGLASAPEGITLQDLAAQLPLHRASLNGEQRALMAELSQWASQAGDGFRMAGKDFGLRPDVMEGGFYLPRGNAMLDEMDSPLRHVNRGSPAGGFPELKHGKFPTMADAINAGYRYITPKEAFYNLSNSSNTSRLYASIGDFLKIAQDEFGNPIARAAALDPTDPVVKSYRDARDAVKSIRGRLDTATRRASLAGKQEIELDRVMAALDNTPDDFSKLRGLDTVIHNTQKRIDELAARGEKYTGQARHLTAELAKVRKDVEAFRPAYEKALDKARSGSLGWSIPKMGELRGYQLSRAVSEELEEFFQGLGRTVGSGSAPVRVTEELSQMLRYMSATGDLSWTTIQGTGLAAVNPIGYGRAIRAMLSSFATPKSYAAALEGATERARDMKRVTALLGQAPTPEYLAGRGMGLFGGGANEFASPKGVFGLATKIPGYEQANRAFATAADVGRLQATLSHIEWQFAGRNAPKTQAEAIKRIDDIIKAVNPITGSASWDFGGSLGKFAFFAPRWMASQIEFVGKGILGTPGYALKVGTGGMVNLNPVGVDIAAKHLTHMIGAGVAMTVLINEMTGHKTQFNPYEFKNGEWRWNSNFMKFRVGGHDYSIFGPWDSLARAAGTMALAVQQNDPSKLADIYRGRANPLVGLIWSLAEGEDMLGNEVSLKWFAKQMLPFSMRGPEPGDVIHEAIFERDPGGTLRAMARLGGSVIGLKSSPLTAWEQFEQELAKNEAALKKYLYPGKDSLKEWSDLTPEGKDEARRLGLVPPSEAGEGISEYQAGKQELEAEMRTSLDYDAQEYAAGRINVDDFKESVRRAHDIYYSKMSDLSEGYNEFKDTGKMPKDPFRRAEAQFYQLLDKYKLPNGTIDWDGYNAELAKLKKEWTSGQAKFIEEQVEPAFGSDRSYPEEVQKFKDAEKLVGESGYYDAKNKRDFLRENPGVAAVIEQYRMSPYQTELRKKEDEMAARMATADATLLAALQANPQDGEAGRKWREAYNAMNSELQDWKDGAGSQLPDFVVDDRDAEVTAYYDFVDAHKTFDSYGKEVTDWAAVDTYVSAHAGLQEKLDAQGGFEMSQVAAVKREDQAKVEASGYFNIEPMAWSSFSANTGLGSYKDYYAWKAEHYSDVSGWDSKENEDLDKTYRIDYKNAGQVAWIQANPEAAYYAVKWGYFTPSSNAEKKALGWEVPTSTSSSGGGGSSSSSSSSAPKAPTKAEQKTADNTAARLAENQKYGR